MVEIPNEPLKSNGNAKLANDWLPHDFTFPLNFYVNVHFSEKHDRWHHFDCCVVTMCMSATSIETIALNGSNTVSCSLNAVVMNKKNSKNDSYCMLYADVLYRKRINRCNDIWAVWSGVEEKRIRFRLWFCVVILKFHTMQNCKCMLLCENTSLECIQIQSDV